MIEQYNGKRLFSNIDFLIKQQKRKIGKVEVEAGVSPGYISRTSKEGGGKPGIDFVMNVARILGVSIDVLLCEDLVTWNATDLYLLSFLNKIAQNTRDDLLDWNHESKEVLNRQNADMNGQVKHPLFEVHSTYGCNHVVFQSKSFEWDTAIHGECYNVQMNNGGHLYVMNIDRVSAHGSRNPDDKAKELWLTVEGKKPQFLCSDWNGAHVYQPGAVRKRWSYENHSTSFIGKTVLSKNRGEN